MAICIVNVAPSPVRRKDTRRIFWMCLAQVGMENKSRGARCTPTGLIAAGAAKQKSPSTNCQRNIVLWWRMKTFADSGGISARKSLMHCKRAQCQFIWAKSGLQSLSREKHLWMRETSAHNG